MATKLNSSRGDIVLMANKLNSLRGDIVLMATKLNSLRGVIVLMATKLNSLRGDIVLMATKLNSLRGDIVLMANKLNSLRGDIVLMANKLNSLRGDIVLMATKLNSLRGDIVLMATKLNSLRGDIVLMATKLNSLRGDIVLMATKLHSLRGDIVLMANKLNLLQGGIILMATKLNLLRGDIVLMANKLKLLRGGIVLMATKLNLLRGDIVLMANKLNLLRGDIVLMANKLNLLRGGIVLTRSCNLGGSTPGKTNEDSYHPWREVVNTLLLKSQKGQEMVVVYRSDVFGIFGPPVDPVTLTFDSYGQSFLAILFKPLQKVSFVSPESGCIDINSLLKLLNFIAGKGFYFCPGIPEQFLIGKNCGKSIILHRLPFKRYQAADCPIYYQSSSSQLKNSSSSYLAICQRCLQAVKIANHLPAQNFINKYQTNLKVDIPKDNKSCYFGEVIDSTKNAHHIYTVPPMSGIPNFTQVPHDIGKEMKRIISMELPDSKLSFDLNTSRGSVHSNGLSCDSMVVTKKSDSLKDKLKSGTTSLRLMLQEKYKKKSLGFPDEALKIQSSRSKSDKQKSNVCKQCKKQFSTPASLLNHLQRHEGLTGSWKNQLKFKRHDLFYTKTSSLLKLIARSSRSHVHSKSKKNLPGISENALKLVLKYLEVITPSMNGTNSVKEENSELVSKLSVKQSADLLPLASDDNGRPSSGLAAVQTLLEAAAVAGNSLDHVNKSNSSVTGKKRKAVAAVLPVLQNSSNEDCSKKSRKSARLATKKSKGKLTDMGETASESSAHDTSMLRNLDLLSTVSLNLHVSKDNPTTVPIVSYSSTHPLSSDTVLTSPKNIHIVPHSNNSAFSNHVVNNTSGGHVYSKSPDKQSYDGAGVRLPPVPPLLYAGLGHEHSVMNDSTNIQKQYNLSQTVQPCPSILRSLVSVSNMPSNECGAIDLSKPKPLGLNSNIPQNTQLGSLPNFSNLAQARTEDPKEMLKCIMMMSKNVPPAASHPPESVISDRRSDNNLQARMFASARNYKIDKKSNSVPQVQAVIASTSRIVHGGKNGKGSGHSAAAQGDEIQCGYKWSGSGGLVKERTQMVRELVPLDVMTSFINRAVSHMPDSQSAAINLTSPTHQHPLSLTSSPVQDSSALNLTTAKSNRIPSPKRTGPGRPRKSAGASFPPSPPPVWPPVMNTRSILRSSLLRGSSPQKSVNLSNNCVPSPNSIPSPVSTTPPICANSSPALSAMLRQPSSIQQDLNHEFLKSGYHHSIDSSALHVNNTVEVSKGWAIKTEPIDNYLQPLQDRIIMALPIKSEKTNTETANL
ncbi:hypothetical protein Btru_052349 [Bulinus truncatus]|nr:hypothetical protein Btru_052349 [Bulinus truncatus]